MERSTQTLGERATLGRAERLIREIRRKTRKGISAKDKISLWVLNNLKHYAYLCTESQVT